MPQSISLIYNFHAWPIIAHQPTDFVDYDTCSIPITRYIRVGKPNLGEPHLGQPHLNHEDAVVSIAAGAGFER